MKIRPSTPAMIAGNWWLSSHWRIALTIPLPDPILICPILIYQRPCGQTIQ